MRMSSIQSHSFKARRSKLCIWPLLIVASVMGGMRPASAASEAIEAEVSLKVWDVLHGTLRWARRLMGRVRPASATSEAIEAEVLLKVWDVLHHRAVGEGGRRAQRGCRR